MNKLSCVFLMITAAASLLACGQSSAPVVSQSLVDVAQSAARRDDRVDVEELAEWLIEARKDFHLIDVRSREDYENGRIADAENIPLAQLVDDATLSQLPTDRKIVLYSNGSENAAKASVMLRLAGFDAHLVTGGYNAWHQRILNPDISAEELDGESPQVSAQRAYSCYFVGERAAGAAQRSENKAPFVPPVFTAEEEDDLEPLPPAGEESC